MFMVFIVIHNDYIPVFNACVIMIMLYGIKDTIVYMNSEKFKQFENSNNFFTDVIGNESIRTIINSKVNTTFIVRIYTNHEYYNGTIYNLKNVIKVEFDKNKTVPNYTNY